MMREWQLWTPGAARQQLELVGALAPQLDSWMGKTHPDQIRLKAYLDSLEAAIGRLSPQDTNLFLHMDIDIGHSKDILRDRDLENYLAPVVRRLGPLHFALASATKRNGGGSQLFIGQAEPGNAIARGDDWLHFEYAAGDGAQYPRWKEGVWNALSAKQPAALPPGPVEAHLAWRCSLGRNWFQPRNWAALWKPTADAMGPVLGPEAARDSANKRRFNPADDRITSLGLHINEDSTMDYSVDVGMWWRLARA
jgi:hypothetical protein